MYSKEQLKDWITKIYDAIVNDNGKKYYVTYDEKTGFTVHTGNTVPDEAVIEISTAKAPFYPNRGNYLYFDDDDAFTQADMFQFVKERIDTYLADFYDNDGYGIPDEVSQGKAIEFYDSLMGVIKELESEMNNSEPFSFPQIKKTTRPKTDEEIRNEYLTEVRDWCGQ